MYSNPRAHRVGRLLAFLIEPFILALAYARTARHRIRDTPRFVKERAYTHTRLSISIIVPCFAIANGGLKVPARDKESFF